MTTKLRLLPLVAICVGGLVLLSAGAIFVTGVMTSRTIVSDFTTRMIRGSLDGLELALRDNLDAANHQANFIAEELRSGDIAIDDVEKIELFLAGSLAAAPQISGVVVGDANGQAVRVVRDEGGELLRAQLAVTDDPFIARIAEASRKRKAPRWQPPAYHPGPKLTLLTLTVPLWRKDEYLGFVAVGMTLQSLSRFTLKLSDPPRSSVFVLYGEDRVLAHTNLALTAPSLSPEHPLVGTAEFIDPVIRQLPHGEPFLPAAGLSLPADTRALRLRHSESYYVVFLRRISGYGAVPLQVGAYSAAREINTPMRSMRRGAAVGAGVLALALLVALAMSRLITRPISNTAAGSAAIASLNFDKVKPLPPSLIAEIDNLGQSFNAMLVGLKAFERYVPLALVQRLIRDNRIGAGSERRELAVMFTDIVGFTSIAEDMPPNAVAELINHHLTLVGGCIDREGGTIDKYIGDSVMAFWGAPDQVADPAQCACRAALAIAAAVAADNTERRAGGLAPLRVRIGIHLGSVVVGDIGAPQRINYTVIGDAVNIAQRLEGLGRQFDNGEDATMLVSRTVLDQLDDSFAISKVGRFTMKGKSRKLGVYRLAPPDGPASAKSAPGAA